MSSIKVTQKVIQVTVAKLEYQILSAHQLLVQCLVNLCSKNTLHCFHLTKKDIVKVVLLESL